jgi:hypothetical protein
MRKTNIGKINLKERSYRKWRNKKGGKLWGKRGVRKMRSFGEAFKEKEVMIRDKIINSFR